MTRMIVAAVVALTAMTGATATQWVSVAHAGPIERCLPSSPLFDPILCRYESPHGGPACDFYGVAYDAQVCGSQRD
jgi:hypothetical protein